MLANIGEKVGIAVVSAALLGALALIWNFATSGGLVQALGGVSRADFEVLRTVAASGVPQGAVLAIDTPGGCPTGWQPLLEGQGRVIVGAAFGQDAPPGFERDDAGAVPPRLKYRDHGGQGQVTLTPNQMPRHTHAEPGTNYLIHNPDRQLLPEADNVDGNVEFQDWPHIGELLPAGGLADGALGTAAPQPNLPPFLALYLCKRD